MTLKEQVVAERAAWEEYRRLEARIVLAETEDEEAAARAAHRKVASEWSELRMAIKERLRAMLEAEGLPETEFARYFL